MAMANSNHSNVTKRLPWLVALVWVCCNGCAALGPLSPLKPLETSVIYHPADWPTDFAVPPTAPIEEVLFESADGTRLHGLFAAHPNSRGVALFCHGNAGNVADRIASMSILYQTHRLSVMMFDYRGYGKSEGKPDEAGILADARAARRWLTTKTGVHENEIIMMGRSLGGAVAIDLAARDGAKALIIASTFPSLPEVAKKHFRLLPANLMMTQRLDSINKIRNYHGPLLQTHGVEDSLIPIELGKKLIDAAASDQKQFIKVPGGHNAPQTAEYRAALEQLLESLP